jgi:hypothetical protein
MPRDYGKLLDSLKELSIELRQRITHEPCRDFLSRISGSGKAAKTAKAILAIAAHDFAQSGQPLMEQALSQRLTSARIRQEIGAGRPEL